FLVHVGVPAQYHGRHPQRLHQPARERHTRQRPVQRGRGRAGHASGCVGSGSAGMISTATRIKVLVFALITVVGVAYVAIRYVRVGDAISSGSYSLYADFGTGGGIFTHASVDYRGFPVGKVGSVSLLADGVRVQLILSEGTRVPPGNSAVVVPRSAVGEQYVDLRPDKETGSYLAAGDVIPRERTGGPLPLETLLVNLDDLVRSINADDVASVLDELGKAFEGNELALQKLLDASSLLVDEALRHK